MTPKNLSKKLLPGRRKGNHRENRFQDLHEKFSIIDKKIICNKEILLFDDVRTSGISILECSDVLLKAGAKNVVSLTLGTHTSSAPMKRS